MSFVKSQTHHNWIPPCTNLTLIKSRKKWIPIETESLLRRWIPPKMNPTRNYICANIHTKKDFEKTWCQFGVTASNGLNYGPLSDHPSSWVISQFLSFLASDGLKPSPLWVKVVCKVSTSEAVHRWHRQPQMAFCGLGNIQLDIVSNRQWHQSLLSKQVFRRVSRIPQKLWLNQLCTA